jgi:hypothetical protein
MEINNLKDLAFYCIRNLNPVCYMADEIKYNTGNSSITLYLRDLPDKKYLCVTFLYDRQTLNESYWYNRHVSDNIELSDDEFTEVKFTFVCAKNDLLDAGLKVFKQDVSNESN